MKKRSLWKKNCTGPNKRRTRFSSNCNRWKRTMRMLWTKLLKWKNNSNNTMKLFNMLKSWRTKLKNWEKRTILWNTLFIFLNGVIISMMYCQITSIKGLRMSRWRSCFWENLKVSINLDRRESMLRLIGEKTYFVELVVDLWQFLISLINILQSRLRKCKEAVLLKDSSKSCRFRKYPQRNQLEDMRRLKSVHHKDLQEREEEIQIIDFLE